MSKSEAALTAEEQARLADLPKEKCPHGWYLVRRIWRMEGGSIQVECLNSLCPLCPTEEVISTYRLPTEGLAYVVGTSEEAERLQKVLVDTAVDMETETLETLLARECANVDKWLRDVFTEEGYYTLLGWLRSAFEFRQGQASFPVPLLGLTAPKGPQEKGAVFRGIPNYEPASLSEDGPRPQFEYELDLDKLDVEHETTKCLDRAKAVVCGDRAHDYGRPSENHARTAKLWAAYLGVPEDFLDARDVVQLNILQKASRDRHFRKDDTLDDQAGYAQNGAWVGDPREGQPPPPVTVELDLGEEVEQ